MAAALHVDRDGYRTVCGLTIEVEVSEREVVISPADSDCWDCLERIETRYAEKE